MRYLKQQERRQQQSVSETEKLQKLKERMESQEAKLKKIRAIRGQVDYSKVINGNLCMCSTCLTTDFSNHLSTNTASDCDGAFLHGCIKPDCFIDCLC